jgi:hypothetical protein
VPFVSDFPLGANWWVSAFPRSTGPRRGVGTLTPPSERHPIVDMCTYWMAVAGGDGSVERLRTARIAALRDFLFIPVQ